VVAEGYFIQRLAKMKTLLSVTFTRLYMSIFTAFICGNIAFPTIKNLFENRLMVLGILSAVILLMSFVFEYFVLAEVTSCDHISLQCKELLLVVWNIVFVILLILSLAHMMVSTITVYIAYLGLNIFEDIGDLLNPLKDWLQLLVFSALCSSAIVASACVSKK
jgi:hypothetical protein